jgi:anti-sigma factor RsiW
MMKLNCEYVRDVYPDVVNGTAEPSLELAVRAHLAECEECRAEAALVDALHAEQIVLPAGLHERVARAAVQPQRRAWHLRRSDIAMAATLAAALLGGGLYLQLQDDTPAPATANAVQHTPAHGLGSVGVEDAMISGKSSLDDLSIEQLEKLLGEVQS